MPTKQQLEMSHQQQFCQENVAYQQGVLFRPQTPYDLFHSFASNEMKNHTSKNGIKYNMVWEVKDQWIEADQIPYQQFFDLLEEKYTHDIGETFQALDEKTEKVETGFNWTEHILSDDCFTLILSFLEVWQMARLRRVCSWWNRSIVNSDMLWYHILKSYTTVGSSQSNNLLLPALPQCDNTSSTDLQQSGDSRLASALVRESCLSPFQQFFTLVDRIPQVELASTLLKDESTGMASGRVVPTVSCSTMRLNCHNGSPDAVQHKLSVIMAIFNESEYVPRLYHYFRVGYCSSESTIANTDAEINHTCVPLLSFCIAVMTGQERELYPVDEAKESFEDDMAGGRVVSVGIGVNTEGDFDPWILYLHMKGRPVELEEVFELCPEAKEVLNLENDIANAYEWFSDERGWANGIIFYNAGFTWFYQNRYFSVYNRAKKQMIVLKLQERVGTY